MNRSYHQSPPLPPISPSSHHNSRQQKTHPTIQPHPPPDQTPLHNDYHRSQPICLSKPKSQRESRKREILIRGKVERESELQTRFLQRERETEKKKLDLLAVGLLVSSGTWWRRRLSELRPWTVEWEILSMEREEMILV